MAVVFINEFGQYAKKKYVKFQITYFYIVVALFITIFFVRFEDVVNNDLINWNADNFVENVERI